MSDNTRSFHEFVNQQLDLRPLDAPRRLSDDDIDKVVMPLIRDDIQRETLRQVVDLLRAPQRDHWRDQLAPLHREIRRTLAPALAGLMAQRYPDRLSDDDWLDAATCIITLAWLVRKRMDGDDLPPFPADN
jgi:hypothetical protein